MDTIDILAVMGIPLIAHYIVSVINGDIVLYKHCTLHTWSNVAFTDKLVCTNCNKEIV